MDAIQVNLFFATPFHVGGGVSGESALFRPILKDALGQPYIPGSTFKGVVRHEAEKLVRGLRGDEALCRAPRPETMCPQTPKYAHFCPVCRTFGSPALPSLWHFADFRLQNQEDTQVSSVTTWRYGVGLSRYRGAAAENLLYATETVTAAPYVTFTTTIRRTAAIGSDPGSPGDFCYSISEAELKGATALLCAALGSLTMLGGGRSRGLGWVNVEVSAPGLEMSQVKEDLQLWLKQIPWQ